MMGSIPGSQGCGWGAMASVAACSAGQLSANPHLGKQQMTQLLGPLPSMWKTQLEFLASDFSLCLSAFHLIPAACYGSHRPWEAEERPRVTEFSSPTWVTGIDFWLPVSASLSSAVADI